MKLKILIVFIFLSIIAAVVLIYTFFPYKIPLQPPGKLTYRYAYKINIDHYTISYGKVLNNQNLSALLAPYLSSQVIEKISRESRNIFDVRKIRSGNKYARIFAKDSTVRMLYFIYEINDIDFVVVDLRDSLRVYLDKKNVSKVEKTASGAIKSSLWNTFEENNLDLGLGMELADVYAWTIDFYGLQKGDRFKVVYEALHVDSIPTGNNHITASVFRSAEKEFYAFYFVQDSAAGYFDEAGQSLQRSFLKAPLRFSRISSRYSRSRVHPILRIARPHFGVDYSAPRGTPVVALGDGKVQEAGWNGGYGRYIRIRHNSAYSTSYAHLSGYAKGIHAGISVKQGDIIGYVGSSGLSTGPHLDFRVYYNGRPVDPMKLESPPTRPVGSQYLETYKQWVVKMKQKLDSVR